MEQLLHYFPTLTPRQREQFAMMGELYAFWNYQINVVSRQDIENIYEKHILHSLGIAKVIQFKAGTEILDVGTGGGFPGIPLAVMFPNVQFHLVDSIGKKIKVVSEVAQALKLDNVVAEQARAESLTGQYEFVVNRAVTRIKPFYDWVKHRIHKNQFHDFKNGIFSLKGGDLAEEMKELGRKHQAINLSDYFEEEFFQTKKVIHIPFS